MKRILTKSICVIVFTVILLCSCEPIHMGWGSQRISDPGKYGELGIIDSPKYFPENLSGYTVNGYYYAIEAWMDVCHEIFLDLTVSGEQMSSLLTRARALGGYTEGDAYYAEGYREIVFSDMYSVFDGEDEGEYEVVGFATVDKVVYNAETGNIIFVQLHAHDTGVFPLSDVMYFKHFGINENEYAAHTADCK